METLDSDERKKGHPLTNAGVNGRVDYRFTQLVSLLEEMNPDYESVGVGSDPTKELIRFEGSYDFGFPAEDIQQIRKGKNGENKVQTKLNFLSLGGAFGPLPVPYSQLVLERFNQKDRGIAGFLNNFQHRLASLVYRVKRHYTPALDGKNVDTESFASHALQLLGFGNHESRNRLSISDRAIMGFSSIFLSGSKSKEGLERLLTRYFETKIRVKPFTGQWNDIPVRYRTTLGKKGVNNALDSSFVLGKRAWLDQTKFLVEIPSLKLSRYEEFLPGSSAFESVRDLIRVYAGDEYDNSLQISLRPDQVPGSSLGKLKSQKEDRPKQIIEQPKLGWNFYLKTTNDSINNVPKATLVLNNEI